MSLELLASAEELLKTANSEMREILEDYILEKKFVQQLPSFNDHSTLMLICKDRDEWEQANHPETYSHYMNYSNFEKVRIEYFNDEDAEVTLNLAWENYRCGSTEHEDRNITIKKSWLWANPEERPWLKEWDRELMSSIKWGFRAIMDVKFPLEVKEEVLSTLGITDVSSLEGEALVEKLPLMKNWILFSDNANKFRVGSCSEILNKTVNLKGKEVNIKEEMLSMKNYSPEKINDIFKTLELDRVQAEKKKEQESKTQEYKALTKKLGNVDLKEIEQLLKLKKELNK